MSFVQSVTISALFFSIRAAEPPKITAYPQELRNAVPGKVVTFTVQATGAEPLSYKWELQTGCRVWQLCDVEGFLGANSSTLTIPSVQKSNQGSYRCVVSNIVGTQTTEPVKLSVGKIQASSTCTKHLHKCVHCISTLLADLPEIITHPQELKDAVPDKFAMLIVQATGTEPLQYQWPHKMRAESGEWQLCDVVRFSGATSSALIILSVQKSDEGGYRCIVSNIAGSQTSEPAQLITGDKFRYVWEFMSHVHTHTHIISMFYFL